MDERFQAPYSHPRWWYAGNFSPLCFDCAHFRGMVTGKVLCTVFPGGIPKEFFEKSMDIPDLEGSSCFEKQKEEPPWVD